MKKTFMLAFGIVLMACQTSRAALLPRLDTQSLAKQDVVLPNDASGKIELLVFGFTHAAKTSTLTWTDHCHVDFDADTRCAIYSIAVLESAPRFIRGFILHSMRSDTAPARQKNFLVLLHGEMQWKALLGFNPQDENDAYWLLVDAKGQIRDQGHGPFRESDYAELKHRIQILEMTQ